jgi:hypothetical protein
MRNAYRILIVEFEGIKPSGHIDMLAYGRKI